MALLTSSNVPFSTLFKSLSSTIKCRNDVIMDTCDWSMVSSWLDFKFRYVKWLRPSNVADVNFCSKLKLKSTNSKFLSGWNARFSIDWILFSLKSRRVSQWRPASMSRVIAAIWFLDAKRPRSIRVLVRANSCAVGRVVRLRFWQDASAPSQWQAEHTGSSNRQHPSTSRQNHSASHLERGMTSSPDCIRTCTFVDWVHVTAVPGVSQ